MIGCDCGTCRSTDPRDKRWRASAYVETDGGEALLLDAGPDLRAQALAFDIRRVDAIPKVTGEFAYSSDLHAAGMLWGKTARSPHAHARIVSIDLSEALPTPTRPAIPAADRADRQALADAAGLFEPGEDA